MLNPRCKTNGKKANYGIYCVWMILSFCYLLQYVIRASPSIMLDELRSELMANDCDIALLGSVFYYIFAIVQIPYGIVCDRYGIYKISYIAITSCIIGLLLSYYAPNYQVFLIARIFIGIGSAAFLICTLKFVADYFPKKLRGMYSSLTLGLGVIGPAIFNKHITLLINMIYWKNIFLLGTCIYITMLFLLMYTSKMVEQRDETMQIISKEDFIKIAISPITMKYSLMSAALYAPIAIFFDLWSIDFLSHQYNLEKIYSVEINMFGHAGAFCGIILFPYLVSKYYDADLSILFAQVVALCTLTMLLQYIIPYPWLQISYFVFGIMCGAEMVCFAEFVSYGDKKISGFLVAILNSYNMMGVGVIEQSTGVLMHEHTLYVIADKYLFGLMPILISIFCCILILSAIILIQGNVDKKRYKHILSE